jgi:hypothetical protein
MGGTCRRTFERELGLHRAPVPELGFHGGWGHRPLAWERGWTSDTALVKRLTPIGELPTGAGGIHSISWSPDGALLASGGEDCRVLVWDAHAQRQAHSLDLVRCSALHLFTSQWSITCMHACSVVRGACAVYGAEHASWQMCMAAT